MSLKHPLGEALGDRPEPQLVNGSVELKYLSMVRADSRSFVGD